MKKIVTVVGARPQFVKAAAVSRVLAQEFGSRLSEVLVHTGQHYDANMSDVFFEELGIPEPKHNLGLAGGSHGAMTGRMLEAIETVLIDERPDWLLIYGDTNSTLAGALAAVKLHIPVAHVEAGLRSFNMKMPEEVNRIVADRVSTLLFCPTAAAVDNLHTEGRTVGVHNVGDVMYDVALHVREQARHKSRVLADFGLADRAFALATCHRAENTDSRPRLAQILEALGSIARTTPVILPLHPRTRRLVSEYGLSDALTPLQVTDPLPFLDMVALEQAAAVILTDSGGVQKEAFFYGVPCITMRDETEWIETVALGMNRLVGADTSAILHAFNAIAAGSVKAPGAQPYGDGHAARRILELLYRDGLIEPSRSGIST